MIILANNAIPRFCNAKVFPVTIVGIEHSTAVPRKNCVEYAGLLFLLPRYKTLYVVFAIDSAQPRQKAKGGGSWRGLAPKRMDLYTDGTHRCLCSDGIARCWWCISHLLRAREFCISEGAKRQRESPDLCCCVVQVPATLLVVGVPTRP